MGVPKPDTLSASGRCSGAGAESPAQRRTTACRARPQSSTVRRAKVNQVEAADHISPESLLRQHRPEIAGLGTGDTALGLPPIVNKG